MGGQIDPENLNAPRAWSEQPGEHLDGGGFARAIGAEETEELAGRNAQVHAIDGNEFSETPGQALSANRGSEVHEFSNLAHPGQSRSLLFVLGGAFFFLGLLLLLVLGPGRNDAGEARVSDRLAEMLSG